MRSPYTTRVVNDETHGYRILVSRFGLESRCGTRLQRGLPGSGNMFEGTHKGQDKQELEKVAVRLEKYLNDNEEKRTERKRR